MTRDRRRINERFADVLEAIENIRSDLGQFGRDESLADGKTQRAVIESLIVMGEAGKRILESEPGLQTREPEMWQHLRDAYDIRIVLTHEYFRVDPTIVWTTIRISVRLVPRYGQTALPGRLTLSTGAAMAFGGPGRPRRSKPELLTLG